jgi:serine/threonine protein kinase
MAKDLIQKLLKTNPAERIKLDDIVEHPWFKSNPPIRAVHTINGSAQVSLLGTQIKSNDYKVISASIEKKPEPRQSLLEQKLD